MTRGTDGRRSPNADAGRGNPPAARRRQTVRHAVESVICLLIAVVLVRSFEVEGYLISTGSMAPHLYGEHKRVECPSCGTLFAVGTEFDDDVDPRAELTATCPNCLRDDIEISDLPKNRGDHLLVWKNAFDLRPPRRWEVVVFRNPNRPLETFIKRVVGLPGDELHIHQGNVFINGQLARKSLAEQRAVRVPVYDRSHRPADDTGWRDRWRPRNAETGWQTDAAALSYLPSPTSQPVAATTASEPAWDWLDYRHTLRSGGDHLTTLYFPDELTEAQVQALTPRQAGFPFMPEPRFPGVTFDPQQRSITCRGVMTERVLHALLAVDPTPNYTDTVRRLAEESHFGPVNDFTAYNIISGMGDETPVTELFLDLTVASPEFSGRLAVEFHTETELLRVTLDFSRGLVELRDPFGDEPFVEGRLPAPKQGRYRLEVSNIDRQLRVSVNGRGVLEPWPLSEERGTGVAPSNPVSLGAAGGTLQVVDLQLFRDVYYTRGQAVNGVTAPFQVGADEYFVLGDNSPVSSDSRNWHLATVPHKLLVGKPFLVHLPSRPGEVEVGGRVMRFRVPDLSRVRFVR